PGVGRSRTTTSWRVARSFGPSAGGTGTFARSRGGASSLSSDPPQASSIAMSGVALPRSPSRRAFPYLRRLMCHACRKTPGGANFVVTHCADDAKGRPSTLVGGGAGGGLHPPRGGARLSPGGCRPRSPGGHAGGARPSGGGGARGGLARAPQAHGDRAGGARPREWRQADRTRVVALAPEGW